MVFEDGVETSEFGKLGYFKRSVVIFHHQR